MQTQTLSFCVLLLAVLSTVHVASRGVDAQSIIVATALDDDSSVDFLGPQIADDDNDNDDDAAMIYDEDSEEAEQEFVASEDDEEDDEVENDQVAQQQQQIPELTDNYYDDDDDDDDDDDNMQDEEEQQQQQQQALEKGSASQQQQLYSAASIHQEQRHSTRYAPVLYTPNVASMSLASPRELSSPRQEYAVHKSSSSRTLIFPASSLLMFLILVTTGIHVLH
ncbi:hypothetical protein VTP01DRAFT_3304 [Rhizomucor pusillus]|uniref:uncharacterized protein n=1 Tax=Rhizomucor pusillus TaxID=4840 RepID=UPI003741F7C3